MNCTTKIPTYCYRHSPELIKTRNKEDVTTLHLQQELSLLPAQTQLEISTLWSTFQTANKESRLLMLKGILASSCTPQLSFISNAVKPLLRTDFTAVFPSEITKHIFSLLDASSLCSAAQVNHHWKNLADDDTLWHHMCEQHINKKCTKCGWGLPLLQKRKVIRIKRAREVESDAMCEDIPAAKRLDRRRPWKDVYSERLVVGRNWRRNRSATQSFSGQHKGGVTSLQFCEAQNILITGSYDKTAIVWNLETGEVLRKLEGHARAIRTLQFDDTKCVTGSMDHTLRIWNYHTGQCIRTLEGHTDGVVHLNFDCRILASGSADASIKIWNFQTGECYTLTGHTKMVNHVSIQKNSTTLISSSDDGSIRIWDLEKRACARVLSGHMAPVQAAIPSMPGFLHSFYKPVVKPRRAISPISSSSDEEELPVVLRRRGSNSSNTSTRSEDCDRRSSEQVVISGSLDNTIKVWSLESGECLQTLFGHVQGIWTLAYDKLHMVSGSHDGSLKLWDIESGLPMHCLEGHASAVTAVALSDTKIVSADDQGEVRIFDFGCK
ncbi:WD40-repeat-containing domain protein [Mucor mucedo]|uniref:WD40-repeat-containing domain protein n=1 Tax=Mucor mucedo TaxID=29922 RepID=UPI00222079AA|nr:WD40-repeat-containing domain protein [Mucor mucedo]KAI7886220.1 WD40-repeat-containing domain protein [Mucor mucedo]